MGDAQAHDVPEKLVFSSRYNEKIVMPGLVPGIHVFLVASGKQDVDGRDI
jgi:hypothetical protein